MIRVKSQADLDKLANRAPSAQEVPEVAPPAASAPTPQPAIDTEARALLRAQADIVRAQGEQMRQLTAAITQQARQAPPAPAPAPAPPAPPPEPSPAAPVPQLEPSATQRLIASLPMRAPPLEADQDAHSSPEPLKSIKVGGEVPMQAEITRDSKGRMDTMHITKGDRKLRATIIRDRKGRIERITTTSEISEHDPAR